MKNRVVTTVGLFFTIVVLLVLMIGLQSFEFASDQSVFNPKSLAATGFIVLAAFTMGEFFKQLKIPALLGYIAAGILFGPNLAPMLPGSPEALFGKQVIGDLALINVLTVGVIGTMGGGELRIQDIRGNVKTILLVISLIFILVVPSTTGAVLLLADYFPSLVPFLDGATVESKIAAALLLGVFALAMSPAATLAILQESRAKGKFTSLVLGIVVVADIALVLFFLLTFALDKLLLAPAGFDTGALMAALPQIGAEFGYALIIGIVTGIIFILYLQFVAREKLLFTVALIFAASYVSQLLHAETLMAFLTAGFIVQNFSRHGHDMIHSLEKISLPVFVIYFMTQAALLDLKAVAGFIGVTVILSLIRALAFYAGAKLGTQWSGASENAKRYLWLCFFSRGGVDLVLAAMVASQIDLWGAEFQTVIMACVVVHIVAGPPLLKVGLDWAGETEGARNANKAEAEEIGAFGELDDDALEHLEDSFPEPRVGDDALAARLHELRDFLIDLHHRFVAEAFQDRTERMRHALQTLSTAVDNGFEDLEAILQSDEYAADEDGRAFRAAAIRNAHVAYRRSVGPVVEEFEDLDPVAITPARVDEVLQEIRGREAFATVYRVRRGEHLFSIDQGDSTLVRLLKVGRTVRRALVGPGYRSIPLGRLWRYFVELSVPRYLARAASVSGSHNEEFWSGLGVHIRRTDDVFTDVRAAILGEEVELHPGVDESPNDHGHAEEHGSQHDDEEPDDDAQTPEEFAVELFAARTEDLAGRRRRNAESLKSWISTSLESYTVSLTETFGTFLDAASHAGTLELPAFRYRPSARFDESRRAEQKLRDRLERERSIVNGHRGWVILDHQLLSFLYWFEDYEKRVSDAMDSVLASPVRRQLALLEERCLLLPDEILNAPDESVDTSQTGEVQLQTSVFVDWSEWLQKRLRPTLRRTKRTFEHTLFAFGQGTAARRLLDALESRIARFSKTLTLLNENPDLADAEASVTVSVSPRDWFASELSRETALRFVELNERVESLMRVALDSLEEIEQVVEFNLLTAQAEGQAGDQLQANRTAVGGLKRASRMVNDLAEEQQRLVQELKRWVLNEIHGGMERSAEPFLDHRVDEVQRQLERRGSASLAERGGNVASRAVGRAIDATVNVWERYQPILEEAVADLSTLLVDEHPEVANSDIRARLRPYERPGQLTIPTIYRRLFTPVPLDIPDFYVDRSQAEAELVEAVIDWKTGRTGAILVHADRGMGKRSLAHHVLQTRFSDDEEFQDVGTHSIRLSEDLADVQTLAREVSKPFAKDPVNDIDGVIRLVQALEARHIVVIENAEKLYHRAPSGIALCESFLRMMTETAENALWILLMNTPAVGWLDTAIGFEDYFTHTIELEPLGSDELELVITQRHRVSGFEADFDRPRPRLSEWIQRPFRTSESLRNPRAEFFRDLGWLSRGNPLLALLYWLETAQVDGSDDSVIRLGTLPDDDIDLIDPLTLTKRLILSTLVQHGTLTPSQLRTILRLDLVTVQTELDHLERLGFVEMTAGASTSCYQMRPLAEALVTPNLRDRNMIA